MAHILVRQDGLPQYYTAKTGIDFANIGGAWVGEAKHALRFDRKVDAENFAKCFIPHDAPFLDIVEFNHGD